MVRPRHIGETRLDAQDGRHILSTTFHALTDRALVAAVAWKYIAEGARIWTGHDVLAQTCSKSVPSQPDPHHRPPRRATTDGPNTPWSRPARVFSGRSSLLAVVDILLPGARARGRRDSTTSSPTRQTHR